MGQETMEQYSARQKAKSMQFRAEYFIQRDKRWRAMMTASLTEAMRKQAKNALTEEQREFWSGALSERLGFVGYQEVS